MKKNLTSHPRVVHPYDLSTPEAELGGMLVRDQPGVYSETLYQKCKGWEYNFVLESLPGMYKGLPSMPSTIQIYSQGTSGTHFFQWQRQNRN